MNCTPICPAPANLRAVFISTKPGHPDEDPLELCHVLAIASEMGGFIPLISCPPTREDAGGIGPVTKFDGYLGTLYWPCPPDHEDLIRMTAAAVSYRKENVARPRPSI